MEKMTTLLVAALLPFTFLSPAMAADAEGFYATVDVGVARASDWCKLIGDRFESCDDSSDVHRISAGYYFNKNFGAAVEITSTDDFSTSAFSSSTGDDSDPAAFSTLNYTSVTLFGLIRVPLSDRFSVYGKGGIHAWEQEFHRNFPTLSRDPVNPTIIIPFSDTT